MTEAVAWVKWRFDRWRNDEGLRMCSLAARGLWADLLAIMHGCTPYGHLMVNGRVPTPKQIASLVGMTAEKEVAECLAELRDNGVCSVADNGAIYCRRMVRDNASREQSKEYGSRGGNPNLVKRVGMGVNPPLEETVNIEKEREKEEDTELRSDASVEPDLNKQLWRDGLAALTRIVGKQDRPLLGKLLDAAGKNHAKILHLLSRCEAEKPSEPVSWLMAGAKSSGSDPRVATEKGRMVAGGYYLDNVAPRLADAAGMATVSETDKTMIRWLEDGIEPDQFLPVIRRISERDDYRPPSSLAYFDKAIREAGRRAA